MFKEFKKFILRGNVVDLAVGLVIGSAFGSLVNSMVKDMITPLVTAVNGSGDFSKFYFSIHGAKFLYGDFMNALVSFIIVAIVIFFFVVQPINKLSAMAFGGKEAQEPTEKKCPHCLSTVPKAASRCKYCTAALSKEKA